MITNPFVKPIKSLKEQLCDAREVRYHLYASLGNMEDIMNMTIEDFHGSVNALYERRCAEAGKPVFKELRDSQKDMIKKFKDKEKLKVVNNV